MIWHNRKINGPVTAGDWNQDPHEVDVDALRKALKIGSGGSGDGVWTLIEDLEFSSPTTSFTIQDLSDYGLLYFLFSFDLQASTDPDNSIVLYINGDTGANNYTCAGFYFTNREYGSNRDHPSPNMHLCRVAWRTRALNEGYAYLHTKPKGYWRALHTHFTLNLYDHVRYGYEDQVGYWKNTEDPIDNILFKVRQDGYGFTGWIKIYGLK